MREPLDLHRPEGEREADEPVVALDRLVVEQERRRRRRRAAQVGGDRGARGLVRHQDRDRHCQMRLQSHQQQRLRDLQLLSERSGLRLLEDRFQTLKRKEQLLEQAKRSDQDQVVACRRQTRTACSRLQNFRSGRVGSSTIHFFHCSSFLIHFEHFIIN